MRIAVVLFNLGGPDCLEAVEPFLFNLFSDRAIIDLPAILRFPLARFAARRRAPLAREIYARLGGSSPINEETRRQAEALDQELHLRGLDARSFVAMRCWRPLIEEAVESVRQWSPQKIVLLPLYPQFSTTTTASSFAEWNRASTVMGSIAEVSRICCYPTSAGLIDAMAELVQKTLTRCHPAVDYRLLLSAHGLPKRIVAKGDPYRWQVERTAHALVERLGTAVKEWCLTFQSRVGPLEWIGPATDAEIRRAGRDGKGVIVAPIAFVSEHSETLVELDIDYAALARESGARDYLRVPTVGVHRRFISALADLVVQATGAPETAGAVERTCPAGLARCYRAQRS